MECFICFVVFATLTFIFLNFSCEQTHKKDYKSPTWSEYDELSHSLLVDASLAYIIATLFLLQSVSLLILSMLSLSLLEKFFNKRHAQFYKAILFCALWAAIACSMVTVRLSIEASFRPSISKLIHSAFKGKNDAGIVIYFTIANLVSELFA